MEQHFILLIALSCLFSFSSGSFFMLGQNANKVNQQRDKPHENTVVLPPSLGNLYNNNNNNNNNINNGKDYSNNFVEPTRAPTTVKPTLDDINSRCVQRSASDFRAHPHDCAKFSLCSAGTLIHFECPSGSVFHAKSKSCVPLGSIFDTCSNEVSTSVICPRAGSYKKAHPKECAQYYHCGHPAREQHWENHLNECEYPKLFNEETSRCEHYSMVTCGVRREPYDPCEYKFNECHTGHCIPCSVRHPSCRGKKNGMNAWKGREGSPHYVVCADDRVVFHSMCKQDKGTQIFDEESGTCVLLGSGQRW